MTDNEIIKALKCCLTNDWNKTKCNECMFYTATTKCVDDMRTAVIALINRQKAEIERLQKHNTDVAFKHYNDGITEFVERVNEAVLSIPTVYNSHFKRIVDRIKKEMEGE